MKFALAAALALVSTNAFADTGHYRELFDVCINSNDPTATQAYCTCSAERLAQLSEPEQLLLIEMATRHLRTPNPTPNQAKRIEAELRAQHNGDDGFAAHLNTAKQAATAAAAACMHAQ